MSTRRRSAVEAVARALVRGRVDGPALRLASIVARRSRGDRAAASLGWHLGQVAGAAPRAARLRSGSTMFVDVRDYAHRHIFLHGVYENDLTALFQRLAQPGWTVVDVGANAGYFSLLAADLGGRRSRVVAFEPQPRMAVMLRRTLDLNAGSAIELVQAACGDRSGTATLGSSPDPRNNGLARLTDSRHVAVATRDVPIVRLDRYCEAHDIAPDLVKIDVEGAENDVLKGMDALLAGGIPRHVVCEVWPASRSAVVAFMASHGYRASGIRADGSLAAPPIDGSAWSNICFHRDAAPQPG